MTLLDVMILIGAAALGLGWGRAYPGVGPIVGDAVMLVPARGMGSMQVYLLPSPAWVQEIPYLFPYVAAATFAVLALRLRRPRPRLRRLMCQPGTVACVAATLVMAVSGPVKHFSSLVATMRYPWPRYSLILANWPAEIGLAVAAVWLTLALGGRWRPERSWIDFLGRLVGACWIALAPFYYWMLYR
jgi:hypothetical protein